jgi:hypothetical protein
MDFKTQHGFRQVLKNIFWDLLNVAKIQDVGIIHDGENQFSPVLASMNLSAKNDIQ